MRIGRSTAAVSIKRRFVALVSVIALLAAGWVSSAHAGSPDGQGCSSACSHEAGGNDHPSGARDQPSDHDSESCALCRVLARVPIPAALPPPLPIPKVAVVAPLPTPRSIAPAGYVGFALARGPPASSPV